MKVCIIQPPYSTDYSRIDEHFQIEMDLLSQCDETMDLIVMPEMCDIPCLAGSKENADAASAKFNQPLLDACSATAKRCNAMLFVSARSYVKKGQRNSTYAFNRQGEIAGIYHKQHLTPGEVSKIQLDCDYTYEFSEPTVIEMEGLRFGFLTCYDFYFYEAFANMARQNLDIIIGCSHQRSDSHQALDIIGRFLSYNTNAYLIRSSVSMDENSHIGGCSMVVAPDGAMLVDMKSTIGLSTCEIDPKKKYYKPAGFGGELAAHYEYIEKGRRPWKYRPGGSAIVRHNEVMPYPRVCAHRGFNTIAPENSLPAFGAAVAMGAEEIEFDLWYTTDGEIVSIHDAKLDRVSNGTGLVYEKTFAELRELDFGIKYGEEFKGLKIPTFEEILKKFACHCIMNIHLKTVDTETGYDPAILKKIIALIDRYDCRKYVYFTTGNVTLMQQIIDTDPHILRCMGAGHKEIRWSIVERAIKYNCQKVQLFKPYFNQEMIDQAHTHGILCNVFWSDDPQETRQFLEMGIDTILTNDYHRISQVVDEYKKKS
ncbi:MAG: hypothetical protein IJ333_08210 [Clostridia bacterium]|nr:hypothetical protein [Clostridia bacterium]